MDIKKFLKQYENQKIYYKANPGNGGDSLIATGAFDLFESLNLNYSIIENNDEFNFENKIVFYAGGGNLVNEYHQCADFIKQWHKKCKELVILPHTINGNRELLECLNDNVTLFCREEKSFEYLKSLPLKCKIYLDHDLAFHIDIEKIGNFASNKHRSILKTVFINKIKHFKTDFFALNAFREDVEKTDIPIPPDNIDLSNQINYQYQMDNTLLVRKTTADIINTISKYKIINTNRLHIAIAGGLLGKKVNLYSNSYWKNKAMYEFSIKNHCPTVNFIK